MNVSSDSTLTPARTTWKMAQTYSGVALSVFVFMHVGNAFFAVVPSQYDQVQRVLRQLYQQPLVEVALVWVPLGVHLGSALVLMTRRIRARLRGDRRATASTPMRWHRYAAWYLLAVIAGHVMATRGIELVYGVYPEQAGVSFAIAWLPWLFVPYYFLLGLGGIYHGAYGLGLAATQLRWTRPRSSRSRFAMLAVGLSAIALMAALAGFGGLLYDIEDPFGGDYARVYRRLIGSSNWLPAVPGEQSPR